ncbi:P-II family nitrogen regulator [Roseateles sp.]|uniref:P-II family nitrogen regulator n=1 Tax=Roseateles sp. TaxID=1971397 RepID=UPI0039E7D5E4
MTEISMSLIVSIVRKGWGSRALQASVDAGARGGTVLAARGAGINEHEKIFGVAIEPEKEVLLTLVPADRASVILDAIVQAAELDATGRGIAFVLPVDRVAGIAHFMRAFGA